jgi:hypothetical protein
MSKYSENFHKSEFGFVEPEANLLTVLERLRIKAGDSVCITSAGRECKKHIQIYKSLEEQDRLGGQRWFDLIPWGSRHLPAFGKKLRASDVKVVKSRYPNKAVKDYYSGEELLVMLQEIEEEMDIFLGIGVGDFYAHIDVDRERKTIWYYPKKG